MTETWLNILSFLKINKKSKEKKEKREKKWKQKSKTNSSSYPKIWITLAWSDMDMYTFCSMTGPTFMFP